MNRVKTVTGHAAHSRWFAELDDSGTIVGYVPRQVHTPYASGPAHCVYRWKGKHVISAETRHKRHEIFQVDAAEVRATEDEIIRAAQRQPALPDAEVVRTTEHDTPEFPLTFALTPIVADAPKAAQGTLFED